MSCVHVHVSFDFHIVIVIILCCISKELILLIVYASRIDLLLSSGTTGAGHLWNVRDVRYSCRCSAFGNASGQLAKGNLADICKPTIIRHVYVCKLLPCAPCWTNAAVIRFLISQNLFCCSVELCVLSLSTLFLCPLCGIPRFTQNGHNYMTQCFIRGGGGDGVPFDFPPKLKVSLPSPTQTLLTLPSCIILPLVSLPTSSHLKKKKNTRSFGSMYTWGCSQPIFFGCCPMRQGN